LSLSSNFWLVPEENKREERREKSSKREKEDVIAWAKKDISNLS